MDDINDHFIICGYGRVSQRVAHELRQAKEPYVVLVSNPAALAAALKRGRSVRIVGEIGEAKRSASRSACLGRCSRR